MHREGKRSPCEGRGWRLRQEALPGGWAVGELRRTGALPLNFSALTRSVLKDPADFLAHMRSPLLIWETPPAASHQLSWVTQPGIVLGRSSATEPLIFEVRKGVHARPSGLGFGITVGRAANNDIMLDDPTVSRFHAAFQKEERTGVWHLHDAESQNGTFLGDARVDARIPAPLASGTRLRFGEVRVLFLMPESFEEWVRSRAVGDGE
jgi:hypothetical protein